MQQFLDKTGHPWKIDLSTGEMIRIKKASKFNLLDPHLPLVEGGHPLAVVIDDDIEELYELIWFIVEPQANAEDWTAQRFYESLSDECLILARNALFEEWRDFFQRIQRYETAMSLEQMRKARSMAVTKIRAKLQEPGIVNLVELIEPNIDAALSRSYGSLRAELEKTLADIHGDNSIGSTTESSVS
jgi:hypothetical protein